jgi:FkbM family methyltransferase
MDIKHLLYGLMPMSKSLYRLCNWYVDFYKGENNDDILTNGELRFMKQALPQCHVVFDVGAHIGNWTALALDINPQLSIHCFEPSQSTYECLVERGFSPSVICNNFGLSSESGERTLYVFEKQAGVNSLYRRQGLEGFGLTAQDNEEIILLKTLDSYCQENRVKTVDYLKLDVEGHELEVLKGSTKMLAENSIHIIQFEYGGANIDAGVLLMDLFHFLSGFGYSFFKIHPKSIRRVEKYDQRLENFQYQNWLAINDRQDYSF